MSQLSNEIQVAIEELNLKLKDDKALDSVDMELLFVTSLLEDEAQ